MSYLTTVPALQLKPGDVLQTNGATVVRIARSGPELMVTLRTTTGATVTPRWKADILQTVWRER